jgi:hypothetical protein
MKYSLRLAAVALTALVLGCGGGPQPNGQIAGEPGPWEVKVVNAWGDTTDVPTLPGGAPIDDSEVDAEALAAGIAAYPTADRQADSGAPATGLAAPLPESTPAEAPRERTIDDFTFGYRIQLMATSSMLLAEEEQQKADALFAYSAYVEYEPPFYKVRLGDFLSRDEAQRALDGAVRSRYDKAWIAETMVVKPGH